MLCEKYMALSPVQKVSLIGELTHAVMSNDSFFEMAQDIIRMAEIDGLFQGVKILPQGEDERDFIEPK